MSGRDRHTSNNAFQTRPDLSLYGSMKAALVKLGRHAAAELARYQIRVNTIAPGWTATPRTCRCDMEQITAQIPLKRWAQPEEIGGIVRMTAASFTPFRIPSARWAECAS